MIYRSIWVIGCSAFLYEPVGNVTKKKAALHFYMNLLEMCPLGPGLGSTPDIKSNMMTSTLPRLLGTFSDRFPSITGRPAFKIPANDVLSTLSLP